MTRRVSLVGLVAIAAFVPPLLAQSSPSEDSLKVAHQTVLSAINSGNPAILEPMLHRRGVGFYNASQMIVQFSGEYGPKEAIPAVLTDLGRFTLSAYDSVYRVFGTTGIVCMATAFQPKKGERGPARYVRSTWVYASLDGVWQLVSWHTSDVPLGKK